MYGQRAFDNFSLYRQFGRGSDIKSDKSNQSNEKSEAPGLKSTQVSDKSPKKEDSGDESDDSTFVLECSVFCVVVLLISIIFIKRTKQDGANFFQLTSDREALDYSQMLYTMILLGVVLTCLSGVLNILVTKSSTYAVKIICLTSYCCTIAVSLFEFSFAKEMKKKISTFNKTNTNQKLETIHFTIFEWLSIFQMVGTTVFTSGLFDDI